ncbi:clarin-3 [Trichechus manatus latirostris]|uniref:Clarin-3 n=1 Tax=Trichechus manatus latirostris TaxID=127582 RepID=A0A2Y9DI22_TRIMA|nr:clarin-3 [Trichechus manatus latirostris]
MPTRKKTLTFCLSFLTSLGSFILICCILGTRAWVTSTITITDDLLNGSVIISYGLFYGKSVHELDHGLAEPDKDFDVLGTLGNSSQKALHTVVIVFLVLSLLTLLPSGGCTCYNSISNPYHTILGPMGVYICNGLSGCFIFLTMILFVVNTQNNHLSEKLSQAFYPTVTHKGATHNYGYSFWLMLLVILLNIVTILIMVFYQKARYQQKKEQRKPMEYAPRDGILF